MKANTIARALAPITAIIGILASTCFAAPQSSSAGERVIIVLDGSGNMWGQIKGEPKISIAKSVTKNLLKDFPEGTELGLTVYGHRR